MSAGLRAFFLIFCLTVSAQGQTRRLGVYTQRPEHLDKTLSNTLRQELERLFHPAGIAVTWQPANNAGVDREFELLVVGSFEGNCSVAELQRRAVVRQSSSVLGDSKVSPGGQVLPFFEIDCENLIATLGPALQPLNIPLRNAMLGRAIARVIAHEIYHFVAQATVHDASGVSKASFSPADLTAGRFDFDATSLERMQPVLPLAQFSRIVPPRD